MSVQAYITAGDVVIPVLLPDAVMQDTARQIGIPEADLFSVDVPVGMTQNTRASFLIASTQVAALFASVTVSAMPITSPAPLTATTPSTVTSIDSL